MKKLFILIGLISSMYAVPPCEYKNQEVCVYYWRGGGQSSEIRIANMSKNRVMIISALASLDYIGIDVNNIVLDRNEDILIKKIEYKDPSKEKKPEFKIYGFTYKNMDE